jgi:hypothetical protein
MASVWLLERGQYSDYTVLGVFSTRANAVKAMELVDKEFSSPRITKRELNPGIDQLGEGLTLFSVSMRADGESSKVSRGVWDLEPELLVANPKAPYPKQVYGTVWATDEAHAIKIANEFRVQAVAEGRFDA